MYIKQSMKRKRDTTTNVKHAKSIERGYIKEILKNAKLLHAVVLGAGRHCAASGKALQAESAASEI